MPRVAVDVSSLRESRDLRLLIAGNLVTGMGTQAALVALPFQLYTQTRSAFLTGLLGAFELVPLVTLALLGGAIADRYDRRRVLLYDQIALVSISAALAVGAFLGETPVPLLYVLGGLLIGATSVGAAYTLDAVSCLAMVAALLAMAPQPPGHIDTGLGLRGSIADGLRFVNTNQALKGSFAIDLLAMTFGMPRALFPVLALSVYGAGAAGTGALFAAVSAGATVAALTTGWLDRARRLGR
ncbi:MAG: hypothetical protein QOI80_1503, partial [Solirubrobacteraceae bacterium]|nr:hypothetical protein [Solirubrobacteraceae bacterium]